MYFYLCFCFIIFLIALRGFTLPLLLLMWTATVILLNAFFHFFDIRDPVAAVVAHPLTIEFIFGTMIGILIQRKVGFLAASSLIAGIAIFVVVLSFPDTAASLIADRNWTRSTLVGA